MRKRIPIKNHHFEIQLTIQRSVAAVIIMSLLICLLIGRLAYLQIYKKNMYTTLSAQNCLDLVPIEPTRGLIFDRNGYLLAKNLPVFSLNITPNEVANINATLQTLSHLIHIEPNELAQFQKQVKQHRRFDDIPLKLHLTEEEVARGSFCKA